VTGKIRIKFAWVKSTDFLAGLTLFFASILFFCDLFDGKYLLTERDLGPYFIPPRFFWVESLKHWDFPLWNPYQFSGHPFFANPQHGMLYPLNYLFFLFPFDLAFNTIIILHFFLGGLFTYLFLKDLKINSTGSLISGLIFMLSGYILSVHSLLTILLSSVWTPLIMMFFRKAINENGFKNEIITSILITISFLGGGIEIVYGNFFVLLIMVFFSNPPYIPPLLKRGKGGLIWSRFRSLLIITLLFLFLSAIQLIPFLELFHYSIRGNGISYQEATIWSFAPKDILLFFLPDAYGYFLDMKKYWINQCWFKTLYAGGLPFLLSVYFFIFGKDRKLYLALMLFSLLLSLGRYNPLYTFVFKYLPFFNGIRYPAKFLYIFILVLSITAGLGFQRLIELLKESENKRLKKFFTILLIICGLILSLLVLGHKELESFLKIRGFDFPQFNHLPVNLFHVKRFFFYLVLFFLLIRIGVEVKWKGWTKILLILFLITDLFGNMGFYGREKTFDYFQKTRILETISSDKGNFRIFTTEKTTSMDTSILVGEASPFDYLKEKHIPSMNLLYQLHDIWGIDVVRLKRMDNLYKAFVGAPSISATNLVNLYGVKYIISVTPLEENPQFGLMYARVEGLQGRKEDLLKENTIKLYKNQNPILRGWLVKDFKVMDPDTMLLRMTSKDFHPDREILLEEEPRFNPPSTPLEKEEEWTEKGAEFISESNNRLKLLVKTQEDALLVLNDTYFPGWKVFVNDKKTKIYRADYAFRAIPLNAGIHRVEFVYDPMSFKLGAGLTLLGILGCIGLGLIYRRNRKV
jgi:hypothetical protein